MNLRKIIREEMDDFEWVKDEPFLWDIINPGTIYHCNDCDRKVFDGLLVLIADKYPEAKWSGGGDIDHKKKKHFGPISKIHFHNNLRLTYGHYTDSKWKLPYQDIDIKPYQYHLISMVQYL